MSDGVRQLANRILTFTWPEKREQRHSQANLMREYLRRAAWISQGYDTPWPFYDFAEAIAPDMRANPDIVESVVDSVPFYVDFFVSHTCEWALHYQALEDTDTLGSGQLNPFSPLILIYDRGNSFSIDKAGFIEVDFIGIPKKQRGDHLIATPLAPLTNSELDLLDESRPQKPE